MGRNLENTVKIIFYFELWCIRLPDERLGYLVHLLPFQIEPVPHHPTATLDINHPRHLDSTPITYMVCSSAPPFISTP